VNAAIAHRFATLAPHLDERQRRLLVGVEAHLLGRGGPSLVARATGVSRQTVHAGLKELAEPVVAEGRVRRVGGGRKRLRDLDQGLAAALDSLVDPDTRGDPASPLRWTLKSTTQLAKALTDAGHPASPDTVGRLLREAGYSLQAPTKTKEGRQHEDRDAQFHYINDLVARFRGRRLPVVSVDAKKKESVGEFKVGGREWQPKGEPVRVKMHDFPEKSGKAIPYGIYDLERNAGWVSVGQDHNTASFAVESLRRWWQGDGQLAYPKARQLLICADGGGSNGYRVRLWRYELGKWAQEAGLAISMCHLPPGTSKWNKIEHRLFAHISMNWRGRPLVSHEVVVQLIAATTTRQGLRVHAERDLGSYPLKVQVTDDDLTTIHLRPHEFHEEWNYDLLPKPIT
jgi:transposase